MKHLIDAHGADKFAQLLATFKDGSTPDDAFQKVYGFDSARASKTNGGSRSGLQPRAAAATPASEPTTNAAQAGATAPSTAPATAGSNSGSGGGTGALTIGIMAALGLMVVGAGSGAYITLRRRM